MTVFNSRNPLRWRKNGESARGAQYGQGFVHRRRKPEAKTGLQRQLLRCRSFLPCMPIQGTCRRPTVCNISFHYVMNHRPTDPGNLRDACRCFIRGSYWQQFHRGGAKRSSPVVVQHTICKFQMPHPCILKSGVPFPLFFGSYSRINHLTNPSPDDAIRPHSAVITTARTCIVLALAIIYITVIDVKDNV